jgi:cytochrome bd ubiquinol oxidase subunit II
MVETWFAIVAIMLAAYVVLDGFDFGAGALHLVVARSDAERRQVLSAIGPFWDGNEVWLLASGGALFVAFPRVLASGLSGFYLAIMLVLWTLILRGISIEFRSHAEAPLWRAFWDAAFGVASATLAILFGAALGNLVRGLPIGGDGWFELALFTDFSARPPVGILDWYTVATGAFALVALTAHGALFLAWKTEGAVQRRAGTAARGFLLAAAILWPALTLATRAVSPGFFSAFPHRPAAWGAALVAASGLVIAIVAHGRGRDGAAFCGSCGFLSGLLGATAACLYPVLLRSASDPALSVTAQAAASDAHGLHTALGWFALGAPLAVVYLAVQFRLHRGRAVAAP